MKILVTNNGSTQSQKALEKAIDLARKNDGEIILVGVSEPVCPVCGGISNLPIEIQNNTPDFPLSFFLTIFYPKRALLVILTQKISPL